MKKEISIIMPSLNEEKNISSAIENCIQCLTQFNVNGELVVINDGSTDRTPEIVKEYILKYPNQIQLVNHSSSQGIGASFWDGVDHAIGDSVVMMPGDNENDLAEIIRYSKLLEHVDLVIPFVFNKQVRSIFRNFLSLTYRYIINTSFMVHFNYTNGTILYRKDVLMSLTHRSKGFFFQTDILIRLVKSGYLFAEVPYKLNDRKSGKSKALSFPSFMNVSRGYLKLLKEIYFDKNLKNIPFIEKSKTASRYNKLKVL